MKVEHDCITLNIASVEITFGQLASFRGVRPDFMPRTAEASGGLEIPEILRAIQAIPVLEIPESVETGSQVDEPTPVVAPWREAARIHSNR